MVEYVNDCMIAAQLMVVNFKTPINVTAYLVKVSFFLSSNHSHLFQAENNKSYCTLNDCLHFCMYLTDQKYENTDIIKLCK